MRETKQLTFEPVKVTIKELRVIDVFHAINALLDESVTLDGGLSGFMQIAPDCVQFSNDKQIKKLSLNDWGEIDEAFKKLNASFFKEEKTKTATLNKQRSIGSLNTSVMVLMEHGYTNVWDYGWGFYLACVKRINEQNRA